MTWLLYKDHTLKGLHTQYFTVWGALSSWLLFLTLLIASIIKYYDHLKDPNHASSILGQKSYTFSLLVNYLYHFTLLAELTIFFVFWIFLYGFNSNVMNLSKVQLEEKLWFDVVQDVENYDHSIPFILVSVEYWISNIQVSHKGFLVVTLLNYLYIGYQGWYLLATGDSIY